MTANGLRHLLTSRLFPASPVVVVDDAGRRYDVLSADVTCDKTTDADGKVRPAGVPRLTLVIRPHGDAT